MSTELQRTSDAIALERVLLQGDLSALTPPQRVNYYKAVCTSLGLNPLTKPFDYIVLNGKLTLYAKRDATEQLRKIHGVSIVIVARERSEDTYVVTARATDAKGRTDESIGAVPLAGLKGEGLSNALMKAETKAKRRVTLSICGLGMTDESETDSIPGARIVPADSLPDDANGPAGVAVPATVADPTLGETAGPVTEREANAVNETARKSRMAAFFAYWGHIGGNTEDSVGVRKFCSDTLGREIKSRRELTWLEWGTCLRALKDKHEPPTEIV